MAPNNISLSNITKKFGRHYVFRDVTTTIYAGEHMAITGSNGSGKSTLLKIIAGYVEPSGGSIFYVVNDKTVAGTAIYHHLSYAAPYLDLIEEFTLEEQAAFYFRFKPRHPAIGSLSEFIEHTQLSDTRDKPIRYFSSGMKQRLKLALAIISNTPILILDEPLTNLDAKGAEWFATLINNYASNRIVIIGSNSVKNEIVSCSNLFSVEDWK